MKRVIRSYPGAALTKPALCVLAAVAITGLPEHTAAAEEGEPKPF